MFHFFFSLELVTRKQKNKKKKEFDHRVSNSKCNFLFFNFELVTRKWNNKKSSTNELVTRSKFLYFLTSS